MKEWAFLKAHPSFAFIWAGSILSYFVERMVAVIAPIWIYEISKSPQLVAIGTIVRSVAMLLFSLIGGMIVDRLPKKSLLVWLNIVAIVILAPVLLWRQLEQSTWLVQAVIFSLTAIMRVINVDRVVFVRNTVGQDGLMMANSLVGTVYSMSLMFGPMMASYGLVLSGYRAVLWFCLIGFAAVSALSTRIPVNPRAVARPQSRSVFGEVREGLAVVNRNPILWGGIVFLASFMVSGGVYSSLIFVFLKDSLDAADSIFPLTITAQGVGNIIGNFLIPWATSRWPTHKVVAWLMVIMVMCELSYLLVPNLPLMFLVAPIVGASTQMSMVSSATIYQKACDPDFLGRAMAFRQVVGSLLSLLATSLAASFLSLTSARMILIVGSLIMGLSAILGYRYVREQPKREPFTHIASQLN